MTVQLPNCAMLEVQSSGPRLLFPSWNSVPDIGSCNDLNAGPKSSMTLVSAYFVTVQVAYAEEGSYSMHSAREQADRWWGRRWVVSGPAGE